MQTNEQEPFTRVSAEEAKRLIDEGKVQLIDVREPNEYERDHIPNARLLPLGTLMAQPEALSGDDILFICEMGVRSAVACEFAASLGLERLYNLEGGMAAWRSQGYPVEK
ncbi:MAG: rhodanese-like domain-containing protein [Chloroflexi bacterium]|nr:rhodanese-like domain-containing protein [Chloroflexota bacterium]